MANTIDNMLFVEAGTPEELKTKLRSIEVPFSIMQGTLGSRAGKHFCWILADRPAKNVKRRKIVRKVEVSNDTKTSFKEDK